MRRIGFALILAGLAMPAVAFADDQTAAVPPPAQMQQRAAQFEQVHQQLATLHKQARAQMLAALTPAHKQLLAQVAGELAISPDPDMAGAVRKLDAALSRSESESILRTQEQFRTQARAIMEQMRSAAEKSMTPEQAQQMAQHHAAMQSMERNERQPTAGELLLRHSGLGMMPMMAPHPM